MTKLINVTPVEVTDPSTGETMICCSRPIVHGPTLWHIFIEHYHGHMDLYQALTAVDGRRFDRRAQLSKADINRARNVFRAIEAYGRENGKPCIGEHGRADAIAKQIEYLNKDSAASNDYWRRRANAAAKEAAKLPRGKTAIRLADINKKADIDRIEDYAKQSNGISESYEERRDQLAESIGKLGWQIRLACRREEEAAKIHADRIDDGN